MAKEVTSRMAVFLFTDIVDSTAIQNRVGTDAYLRLLARHDAIYREAVVEANGGRIVEKTGDGFLAELPSPSDAVNAALRFQTLMCGADWGSQILRARAAIHLGEITELVDPGTGEKRHGGMAINFAARLMDLGQGGQILLSRAVFDDARRNVKAHPATTPGAEALPLRWEAHGRYLFKGAEEPTEVFEVGVVGVSPLSAPPDGNKARRYLDAEEEQTLGWRPASGLEIPRRKDWVLVDKIGEGGFGEVWLAEHVRLRESRVFKFCFDAERLRSFRREVTLFRLLRDTLGQREDIAGLHDVQVEKAPFFLESVYYPEGNLADWAVRQGGLERVPIETRLDILARVACAAAAAHSVGVIHKDIKPSNVLVSIQNGQPRPRLADFGIGELADRAHLHRLDITEAGFTGTLVEAGQSSRTGTRIYSAPEYLSGGAGTVQGDVYALGVMLYQMVVGDFTRPLGPGWERDVPDPLLREDIAAAVDGDPARRLATAGELAERIQSLDARRAAHEEALRQERRRVRRRRWLRVGMVLGLVGLVLVVVLVRAYRREVGLSGRLSAALAESRKARDEFAKAWARNEIADSQRELDEERLGSAVARLVHAIRLDPGNALASSQLRLLLGQEAVGKLPLRVHAGRLGHANVFLATADGRRAVAVGFDGFRLIDWESAGAVGSPVQGMFVAQPIRLARDGHRVLTWQRGAQPKATVWEFSRAATRPIPLPSEGNVDAADLSPDGLRVVIASGKSARVWDVDTGMPVGPEMARESDVDTVEFGADGRVVIMGSPFRFLRVWTVGSGRPEGPPIRFETPATSMVVRPDASQVAAFESSVGWRLWNTATGKSMGVPIGTPGNTLFPAAAYSPDGTRLVTGAGDRVVRIHDTTTGKSVGEAMVHRGLVTHIAFGTDGKWLATASEDGTARVWDARNGRPVGGALPHPAKVLAVAFASDGRRIHTACADGAIRDWALPSAGDVATPELDIGSLVEHAEFNPEGDRVLAVADGAALVWDWLRPGSAGHPPKDDAWIQGAAFGRDGGRLWTWTREGVAQLWDTGNWTPAMPPVVVPTGFAKVGIARDGRLMFTVGEGESEVVLRDAATGKPTGIVLKHQEPIQDAAFSPDGKYLYTADGSKARLSDAATGARVSPILGVVKSGRSGPFSRDGKRMVAPDGFGGTVFSVPGCEVVGTIARQTADKFWSFVALGPDGHRLAAATDAQWVELWDVDGGRRIGGNLLHGGKVNDIAFSPDGRWIATACDDGVIRLWDAGTGSPFGRTMTHGAQVESVAFSPDGHWLVSASRDRKARVWPAPPDAGPCSERLLEFGTRVVGMEIDAGTGVPRKLGGGEGPSLEFLRANDADRLLKGADAGDAEIIRRCLGLSR